MSSVLVLIATFVIGCSLVNLKYNVYAGLIYGIYAIILYFIAYLCYREENTKEMHNIRMKTRSLNEMIKKEEKKNENK